MVPYVFNIDSVSQLQNTPGVHLIARGGSYRGLGFNVKTPPFDDLAVRDAISKAMDIDAAVKAVVEPFGQRAYGQVPPWVSFTQDPGLKDLWTYDPEAALKELADAGWSDHDGDGILDKDGKPLSFSIKTIAGSQVRVLTILVTQLKQLGIDAKLLQQDVAVWADDLQNGNDTGLFFDYSFAGTTGLYSLFYGANAGKTNTHFYQNDQVDALLDEASATIDFQKRNDLWLQAQRLIMKDRAAIPLYFENGYSIVSDKVHDFVPPWPGSTSYRKRTTCPSTSGRHVPERARTGAVRARRPLTAAVMGSYAVRRLLMLIPVLFGISFITFSLMSFAPGNAISLMLAPRR